MAWVGFLVGFLWNALHCFAHSCQKNNIFTCFQVKFYGDLSVKFENLFDVVHQTCFFEKDQAGAREDYYTFMVRGYIYGVFPKRLGEIRTKLGIGDIPSAQAVPAALYLAGFHKLLPPDACEVSLFFISNFPKLFVLAT